MTEDQAIEVMAWAIAKANHLDLNRHMDTDQAEAAAKRGADAEWVDLIPEAKAALAALRPYLAAQFAAGAEAMREVCAAFVEDTGNTFYAEKVAEFIRVLRIPSPKDPNDA